MNSTPNPYDGRQMNASFIWNVTLLTRKNYLQQLLLCNFVRNVRLWTVAGMGILLLTYLRAIKRFDQISINTYIKAKQYHRQQNTNKTLCWTIFYGDCENCSIRMLYKTRTRKLDDHNTNWCICALFIHGTQRVLQQKHGTTYIGVYNIRFISINFE